nr:zf-HC2 domain-containing protein [Armatimonadota bacterium]
TMNCLQAEKAIQEMLDGALTAREREALDAHLADCAGCRAAREEYQNLARAATVWTRRPLHEVDLGEAFTAQVMAQIAAQSAVPGAARVLVWRSLVWVSVIVAALCVCGLWLPSAPAAPLRLSTDWLPRPQTALELPVWLGAFAGALPSASARLWGDLTAGVSVPGTMLMGLLSGALLLNGLLYARAARPSRGRWAR